MVALSPATVGGYFGGNSADTLIKSLQAKLIECRGGNSVLVCNNSDILRKNFESALERAKVFLKKPKTLSNENKETLETLVEKVESLIKNSG